MSYEDFRVEESMALLHTIFLHYPSKYGMKLTPEIGAFLRTLRLEASLVRAVMGQSPPCGGQLGLRIWG